MKTLILLAALLSVSAWSQTIVTNRYEIHNHGGWALNLAIGADDGDAVSVAVKCDHPINKMCFAGPPTLDGKAFKLYRSSNGKQEWQAIAASTGDHVIIGNYPWVGVDVHYHILILANEVLQ